MKQKFKYIMSKIKSFFKATFVAPLQLIVHPISGWEIFKQEKTAKRWVSIFYVCMMIFAVILNEIAKCFIVGGADLKEFNLFRTILVVLLPVLVGVIANWCVGSLLDGKGKPAEIFDAIAYSFFPYVWLSIIATIVSNFIATDEMVYYTFIMGLGVGLTIWMMFFGIMGVNENSFGMNVINIVFTIIVIAVIIFTILLFFSFVERILGWLVSIYNEIKMRYF